MKAEIISVLLLLTLGEDFIERTIFSGSNQAIDPCGDTIVTFDVIVVAFVEEDIVMVKDAREESVVDDGDRRNNSAEIWNFLACMRSNLKPRCHRHIVGYLQCGRGEKFSKRFVLHFLGGAGDRSKENHGREAGSEPLHKQVDEIEVIVGHDVGLLVLVVTGVEEIKIFVVESIMIEEEEDVADDAKENQTEKSRSCRWVLSCSCRAVFGILHIENQRS